MLDLFVSRKTLPRALEVANTLYLDLEDRGHRVVIAPQGDGWHRPNLELGNKPRSEDYWYRDRDTWGPGRPTIVMIDTVAIGLTLYELSEAAEVRSVDGAWVRVAEMPPPRRGAYDWKTTKNMPTGKLCLQAFSPYQDTRWQQGWREERDGQLRSRFRAIAKQLEEATATVVTLVEEAARRAELERQRGEAHEIEEQRRRKEHRRLQAIADSRKQLFAAIDQWGVAKSIEGFFEDAEKRAARLGDDERAVILDRLARARQLVGAPDALQRLREWKAPDER